METSLASRSDSLLFASRFYSNSLRSSCLNLLNDLVPWIDLINDCKKATNLGLMTRHHLQLIHKVIPLPLRHQCQFVHIMSVAHLVHFQGVLLKFEHLQKLINWKLGEILLSQSICRRIMVEPLFSLS